MSTLIELDGTTNTRDIGGYVNKHNVKLKYNKLFRSDKLSELTKSDMEKLKNLGIKKIIDFRGYLERETQPNVIIKGIDTIHIPIDIEKDFINNILKYIDNPNYKKETLTDMMANTYKEFITKYLDSFRKFIDIICNEDGPIIYHCTAGKDRTGFATILIYLLSGINLAVIKYDYMKSNYYINKNFDNNSNNIKQRLNINDEKMERMQPLMFVEEKYFNMILIKILEIYGSVENFIKNGLQIHPDKIKKFHEKLFVCKL